MSTTKKRASKKVSTTAVATVDPVSKELDNIKTREEAQKRYAADQQMQVEMKMVGDVTPDNGYDVPSVNANDAHDMSSAMTELVTMQQKIASDYSDWAKLDVNYSVFGEPGSKDREMQLVQRLKSHNDAYTMSMLTSCYTPLTEGIDVKTLASTYFTHKMVQVMNPDLQMDKARMYANFASNLRSMSEGYPLAQKFASGIEDMLGDKAATQTGDTVAKSLRDNTLDSLVMTPRQLAAIKLNFMEQYYTDTRSLDQSSPDYESKLKNCTDNYDKAIQHIGAIANNSGYEMSAVADEERYLVGLRIRQDDSKHYENIFSETQLPYGAQMQYLNGGVGDENNLIWQGDFKTPDGHAYTCDANTGAFTVRQPYTADKLPSLQDELSRKGQQYAWMQQFINSSACTASSDAKKDALENLQTQFDQYKDSISIQLQDDLGYSKNYADSFFDKSFGEAERSEKGIDKNQAFAQTDVFSVDSKALPGMDFYRELRYVTEKESLKKNPGVNISAGKTENPTPNQQEEENNSGKAYRTKTDLDLRRDAIHKIDPSVNIDTMGRKLSGSYMRNMSGDELTNLMLHVGCNMEQGWQHNMIMNDKTHTIESTYSRHLEPSVLEGSTFEAARQLVETAPSQESTAKTMAAESSRPGYDIEPSAEDAFDDEYCTV